MGPLSLMAGVFIECQRLVSELNALAGAGRDRCRDLHAGNPEVVADLHHRVEAGTAVTGEIQLRLLRLEHTDQGCAVRLHPQAVHGNQLNEPVRIPVQQAVQHVGPDHGLGLKPVIAVWDQGLGWLVAQFEQVFSRPAET